MRKNFCGWYFKCQSETNTLAVIAAVHGDNQSVQVISDNGAWSFTGELRGNLFGRDGFVLDLHSKEAEITGKVKFRELTPIKYDIMGPFALVPFMQCRHSVVSMCHRVDGEVQINGVPLVFEDALGYIEGDRGYSFPSEYVWTHSFFEDGSLMLSAADIPFLGAHFTGVIGIILWQGREYRLASYLGARAESIGNGEVLIKQGRYTLRARLTQKKAHVLNAPVNGEMVRTIHESACCRAAYRFEKDGITLLEFETDRASFEYEYGK